MLSEPEALPEPVLPGPMAVPLDDMPVPPDVPDVLISDDDVPAPVVPAVPAEALPPVELLVSVEPAAPELLAPVPGCICSADVRPAASVPEPAGSVMDEPAVPDEEVEPPAPDDELPAPDAPLAESLAPEAPLAADEPPASEAFVPEAGFICSLDARPAASVDPAPSPADCDMAAADVPAKTTSVSA